MNEDYLSGEDFSGQNLQNKKFSYKTFVNSNFSNADLTDANFFDSNLWGVNFENANLTSANFGQAELDTVSFQNADLRKANFRFAIMESVNFSGARISGATFNYATIGNANLLEAADLDEIKQDLFNALKTLLDSIPSRINDILIHLLEKFRKGNIDGRDYGGCIVGQIANYLDCKWDKLEERIGYPVDQDSPREAFLTLVTPKNTPENHEVCRILESWLLEFQTTHCNSGQ